MRTSEMKQPEPVRGGNPYEERIIFIWDLIGDFTRRLMINKKSFYSKVNSILRESDELSKVTYGEHGLEKLSDLISEYRNRKFFSNRIYVTATYLSSLSRLLSAIFNESARSVGAERSRSAFLRSFTEIRSRYSDPPDLTAYMPAGLVKEENELSVTTYPSMIMDKLIDYLVNDVISKGPTSPKKTEVPIPTGQHATDADSVEKVYLGVQKETSPAAFGSRTLGYVVNEVAKMRSLKPEQRDYVYLYLILEDFIVQKGSHTSESLRKDIKERFNVRWFDPRLGHIFMLKNGDKIVFSEIILEATMENLENVLGPKRFQAILEDLVKGSILDGMEFRGGRLEMSGAEKKLDAHTTADHDSKAFMDAMINVYASLYNTSKTAVGESAAQKAFSSAFQKMKSHYEGFPVFSDFLRQLPKGVLDTEKFDILSKEELEKIAVEMKKTDVMKSEFTNIAAHELKTPIVPLKGFLEIMHKDPEKYGLNDKGREYVDVCLRNVVRLNSLIGDILDISKLEAGEMKFDMGDVDMSSLVRNSVTDFSTMASDKGLELRSSIQENVPIVHGDQQRLTQVIENIIGNAIKFTDKGYVSVGLRADSGQVKVEVSDTGMGIEKENIPKLFTKFFQTQQSVTRKTKGTGLGLAISRQIIESHKGKIWADSKGIGMGTSFYISIPFKSSEVEKSS